jgi:hypothetical protein
MSGWKKVRPGDLVPDRAEALPDRDPWIVSLLADVVKFEQLGAEKRARVQAECRELLGIWVAREDLEELRELVGLKHSKRNRRRTHRQANRELAMAFAYAQAYWGPTERPSAEAVKLQIMQKFSCSRSTLERALSNWEMAAFSQAVVNRRETPPDVTTLRIQKREHPFEWDVMRAELPAEAFAAVVAIAEQDTMTDGDFAFVRRLLELALELRRRRLHDDRAETPHEVTT